MNTYSRHTHEPPEFFVRQQLTGEYKLQLREMEGRREGGREGEQELRGCVLISCMAFVALP